MKLQLDEIEKLIKLMQSYGLAELKYGSEEVDIELKAQPLAGAGYGMAPTAYGQPAYANMTMQPAMAQPMANYAVATPAAAPTAAASAEGSASSKSSGRGKALKSPFVGTFYSCPSPGAPSFVEVGKRVSKGQTLCIIEAMKIMNEIEAEADGVIVEVLVRNEETVEYDQPLFVIE